MTASDKLKYHRHLEAIGTSGYRVYPPQRRSVRCELEEA
jgi:hypothetical protein